MRLATLLCSLSRLDPWRTASNSLRRLFRRGYRTMLDTVLRRGLPTIGSRAAALCIITCIIREAAVSGVPIIDLSFVCGEDADFANAIEPSVRGGNNIAAAIVSAVTQFAGSRSEIFTH